MHQIFLYKHSYQRFSLNHGVKWKRKNGKFLQKNHTENEEHSNAQILLQTILFLEKRGMTYDNRPKERVNLAQIFQLALNNIPV